MNVTFLIGNGFDLRLGMYTRYSDMYTGYINSESNNRVIDSFKMFLEQDAPSGYETWSDFEMAMAQYAQSFSSENDFIQCVRDFKNYMVKHLSQEQQDFIEVAKKVQSTCAQEFSKSLEKYYLGQTPNVVYEIESLQKGLTPNFNFITFNYTIVLDYLLSLYNNAFKHPIRNAPIHIHGTLSSDVVLGVDNYTQLHDLKFPITKRVGRAFIKPLFNEEFDKVRIAKAEKLISESDVICVYGMSLGDSDITWRTKLSDWLLQNHDHHLIYYFYSTDVFNKWQRDEMMDEEDARKMKLLAKICDNADAALQIYDQIHIPVGYDIFDFRNSINISLAHSKTMTAISQ